MSKSDPDSEHVVEQALSQGELYRAVFDQLEEGIYIVDSHRRILYWNSGAEEITGYLSHEVAGRTGHDDMMMNLGAGEMDAGEKAASGDTCDASALSEVKLDGRPRDTTLYLRHRHGHRVPIHLRSRAIFDANGQPIGAVEVFREAKAREGADLRLLQAYGCLEKLTNVASRQYGEMQLTHALEGLKVFGIPFGWLAVQLDQLEELEHRFGHGLADSALKLVARTLAGNVGSRDTVSYWEPGEFRIEAYSCWREGPAGLAERLVELVRACHLDWWGDPVKITISIGGGLSLPSDTHRVLEVRTRAALAACRSAGGNRASILGAEHDASEPRGGTCSR